MKTIQNFTGYQFTERIITTGDKAIKAPVRIAVFTLLLLPFVLMIAGFRDGIITRTFKRQPIPMINCFHRGE